MNIDLDDPDIKLMVSQLRDAPPDAKARKKIRQKAYYEANREKIRRRQAAYREAHREELREYFRNRDRTGHNEQRRLKYNSDPEYRQAQLDRMREWRQSHEPTPEQVARQRENQKRWERDHREACAERHRRYYRNHPEARERENRRRREKMALMRANDPVAYEAHLERRRQRRRERKAKSAETAKTA